LIDNFTNSKLAGSLGIDPSFAVTDMSSDQFLGELGNGTLAVNVLVLANLTYSPSFIAGIKTYLDSDNGSVFLAMGTDNVTQGNLLYSLGLLTSPSLGTAVVGTGNPAVPEAIWAPGLNASGSLVNDIDWKAVPNIQVYSNSSSWNLNEITQIQNDSATGAPLLFGAKEYPSRLYVATSWICSVNLDFELCLFFNYFNYHVVENLSGLTAMSYLAWPYSPVPHTTQDIWIYLYLVIICIIGVGGFFIVRRYSKRAGAALKHVMEFGVTPKPGEGPSEEPASGPPETPMPAEVVSEAPPEGTVQAPVPPENEPAPQVVEGEEDKSVIKSEWDRIGIHRQIAQFFLYMIMNAFIAIPIMVLALFVYPDIVLKYPMASGWQTIAGNFFSWLATIADMGMTVAAGKYFAQYRVHNPQKAVHYLQMLVWWNILTSIVKTLILVYAGLVLFRTGNLGYLSWMCILIALQQFPNCQGILGTTLNAMQRWDYKVLCDTVGGSLLNTLINYAIIILCRAIYAPMPLYGAAFGTAVGLYVGSIVTSWTSFLYYGLAFKKLGFHIGTLFRAEFTKDEVKEALNFGWKLAVGNVIVPLVTVLETYMVATYVLNAAAEEGYYSLMSSVVGFIGIDLGFFSNLMPAMSEAYGNGKNELLKYYITEGFHYINLFLLVLFTVILAIGGPLLVGFAGQGWAPATKYVVPLALNQLLTAYSGIGDNILQGTGNTQWDLAAWCIEQPIRAVLLIIIMPAFHPLWAILLASVPAALVKEAFMFTVIKKRIANFSFSLGHNFIAPGLSAFILYFYSKMLVYYLDRGTILSSIEIFGCSVFGGLMIYLFLVGFFGGWDSNTIGQFKRGLEVVKFTNAFFLIFYKVTALGHRLCPWRNRFTVKEFETATAEAKELTSEKKKLVM
jgi:O-antigen/teichoic acid export membrane protein